MSAAVDHDEQRLNGEEVRRALALYEGVPGRLSIMYLQDRGEVPTYTTYATTAAEIETAARDVAKADMVDEPLGVYVRGTTITDDATGRGKASDSVAWTAIRCDLDMGKPGGPADFDVLFDLFDQAGLPDPTYWQHSGGGFYPTWQFAEPVAHHADVVALAEDVEHQLRRTWNDSGYTSGVDSCADAARVWRLAGSVHRKDRGNPITSTTGKASGVVYTLAELRAAVPHRAPAQTWDGDRCEPRLATAEQFEQTYRHSLEAVLRRGRDDFRHTYFLAARNGHRMVAIGLRTADEFEREMTALVNKFWPEMGLNTDDRRHLHDALHNPLSRGDNAGALASPWEISTPTAADSSAAPDEGSAKTASEHADDAEQFLRDALGDESYEDIQARGQAEKFEAEVAEHVRRLDIAEQARQRRTARDTPPLSVLSWTQFLDAPQPDYLVPHMLYRDSTAKVYGAPGSTKSYLLLDLALALSHGVEWFGMGLPRTRVHYVAAEGQAVNVARALGWMAAHDVDPADGEGWFDMIPEGVLLTEPGVAAYLERVRDDQPGLIILDTKNAMMDGDENHASDVAVMVRAMRSIRDAAGGACVVLVDHTGLGDTGRGRGSNAVTAAMDTEILVESDRDTGVVAATVTRDKSDEPGHLIEYRLRRHDRPVPGQRPGARPPAYIVPLDERELRGGPLSATPQWWDADQAEIPDEISSMSGRGAAAARDIFRIVRYVADPDGMTRGAINAALKEGRREHSGSAVGAGLTRLSKDGHLDKPSASRYALGAMHSGD